MDYHALEREESEVMAGTKTFQEIIISAKIDDFPARIANEVVVIIAKIIVMHLPFRFDHDHLSLSAKRFEDSVDRREANREILLLGFMIDIQGRRVIKMRGEIALNEAFLQRITSRLIGNHFH